MTVITKGAGGLAAAEWVENYYGFAEPISGAELEQRGIAGAKRLGVRFETDEVLAILPAVEGKGFCIEAVRTAYEADAVILAAGAPRKTLPIKGLREFEGRGVSYCAICDAFFYRGKRVAVIGAGDYALHEAEILRPHAAQLSLLTNGEEPALAMPDGIAVHTQRIVCIEGERRVQRIVFDDETVMDVDGIFMAIGTAGSMELARKLGVVLSDGKIAVGKNMETNVPGVYAAGDVRKKQLRQVITAVADGANAVESAVRYLTEQ